MRRLSVFALVLFFSADCFASSEQTKFVQALKFPNSALEGTEPVRTLALMPDSEAELPGFSELTNFIFAAPDQEDAGTCLYMSLTGILEWWAARLNPGLSREADGPLDLSERYTVNKVPALSSRSGVRNWKTDSIFAVNQMGYAVTNRSYRFAKGYFKNSAQGYIAVLPAEEGALFGTLFNWVNQISDFAIEKLKLPRFEREVLFADPSGDQWNVGAAPSDLVDVIKDRLQSRKAPVHVIYNHYGYWHATVVVGFDDEGDSRKCQFVEGFRTYMKENPIKLREKAALAEVPAKKQELLNRARAQESTSRRVEAAWERGGGCVGKGVFYVRDSIYGGEEEAIYDYNASHPEGQGHYSKRIVNLEFEWIKYLANHAVQIYVE